MVARQFPDWIDVSPLALRRWDGSFASAMVSAIASSFEELHAWMPWASVVPTAEAMRATLIDGGQRFERNEDWPFVIIEGPELVGSAGLHRRSGPSVLEIGYWIRTDRTRRGYATSVARTLTSAAFEMVPELERVEIVTHGENVASQAVARRLGFSLWREETREPDGTVPGGRFCVWSMDRSLWTPVA